MANGEDTGGQIDKLVFTQNIQTGEMVRFSLKNALLNIITLTLYRFWGATELRRKLWSSTQMNGEPFEYTGKGSELFKGFILALVVFVIPYLAVLMLAQTAPWISAFLVIVFALAIYLLVGAAIWLSFRYIASRTTWRGIRFSLGGKPVEYGFLFLGQILLVFLTLGLWLPRAGIKLAGYLFGHLRYGDLPVSFDEHEARQEAVYKPYMIAWLTYFLGYLVWTFLVLPDSKLIQIDSRSSSASDVGHFWNAFAVLLLWFTLVFVAYLNYQAAFVRAITRGTSIGGARFTSSVRSVALISLVISNILIVMFSLGILTPLAKARSFRFHVSRLSGDGPVDLSAARQAERGPTQGEGMADLLDVGLV